jgi:hypothetical protein
MAIAEKAALVATVVAELADIAAAETLLPSRNNIAHSETP